MKMVRLNFQKEVLLGASIIVADVPDDVDDDHLEALFTQAQIDAAVKEQGSEPGWSGRAVAEDISEIRPGEGSPDYRWENGRLVKAHDGTIS